MQMAGLLTWDTCSNAYYLITARVKYPQKLSVTPVKAWVAVEQSGIIICAHCDCMAGLGEACSHISAIVFALDANTQERKSLSCTSLPCSWLPPTFKNVPLSHIDFSKKEKTSMARKTYE